MPKETKAYTNVMKRFTQCRLRGSGSCSLAYSVDGAASWSDATSMTLGDPHFIDAYGRRLRLRVSSTAPFELTSHEVWAVVRGPDLG
jgi:hypothetical protein